jgi:hypothetical protein
MLNTTALVQGGELPLEWLLDNLAGSRGGAELAFMSTSLSMEEAAKYASRGVNPILLEIKLGQVREMLARRVQKTDRGEDEGWQVDKGADIGKMSQYPSECEILFPPMTNLEVEGEPRMMIHEGRTVMVLTVRPNVSLANQTREQLDAKRADLFLPTLDNVLLEAHRDVDTLTRIMLPKHPAAGEKWLIALIADDMRLPVVDSGWRGSSQPGLTLEHLFAVMPAFVNDDLRKRLSTVRNSFAEHKAVWFQDDTNFKVN